MNEEHQAKKIMNELILGSELQCVFKRIRREERGDLLLVIYNFGQLISPNVPFEAEVERKFRTTAVLKFLNGTNMTNPEVNQVLELKDWHCVEKLLSTDSTLDTTGIESVYLLDHNGNTILEAVMYFEHLKSFPVFYDSLLT